MMQPLWKKALLNGILYAFAILVVLPFVWMILSSFKTNAEISAIVPTLWPKNFITTNYTTIQSKFNFYRFFTNSLFISITQTVIICYTSTVSGFVLAKYEFKGKNVLFAFILGTMMIPGMVTLVPSYNLMVVLGWLDSYAAIIVPGMISAFGIFMLRQSFLGLPNEILEAARIDGASEYYILHRIVFPLAKNSISSIAIFQFLWSWDSFLWPYLVISTRSKQMLSVGLAMFQGQWSTDYGGLFAATTISIMPVIIVYFIFQKRFIDGVAASAVKG